MVRQRHLVVAPDKFRGSATAAEVSATAVRAAQGAGWSAKSLPTADGGEGTLEALGGQPRFSLVAGPLGVPVMAEWRYFELGPITAPIVPPPGPPGSPGLTTSPGPAVLIEMARCAGLALAGGAEGNDPVAASTAGVGQLIAAALAAGATQVVVACGGSASTDGGWGALEALGFPLRLDGIDLVAAYDVEGCFVDAATDFAPQKGATSAQVSLLRQRLAGLVQTYQERNGVDVRGLTGAAAAGGLAGGLAAIGARLVSGFSLVARSTGLARALAAADLVITGEGHLDRQSFSGKVVGGVLDLARTAGVPALVIVGDADPTVVSQVRRACSDVSIVSLTALVGRESALSSPLEAIETAVARHLAPTRPGAAT